MDVLQIKEDLFEPYPLETTNTYVKMHHGPINDHSSVLIIKPASIKGNEHVLQELFQRLPLHSPAIQFERNERPLLSVFIWLNDCWMDWSQLIRQWQEALLLAQWPTPTKDRNHQQNSHCPQIDFGMPTKPRRCHSKPAVSHYDTSTWPKHLNPAEIRLLWITLSPLPWTSKYITFPIYLANDRSSPDALNLERTQVKCLKGGFAGKLRVS